MRFAEVGLVLGGVAVACWVFFVVLVVVGPRFGIVLARGCATSSARTGLVVGSGAAAGLFAAQAGLVDTIADRSDPGPVDASVLAWFVAHRAPAATLAMTAVTTVGGTVGMTVVAVVGILVLWRAGHRPEAATVAVAAGGAGVLVTVFKNFYGRARPPVADHLVVETNAALPSGHALGSAVVLGVLAASVLLLVSRTVVRVMAVGGAVLAIGVIGVSRLYLGVHWITDVLTGWLLGGAWLAACVTVLLVVRGRGAPMTPATAATP